MLYLLKTRNGEYLIHFQLVNKNATTRDWHVTIIVTKWHSIRFTWLRLERMNRTLPREMDVERKTLQKTTK
jgi:hypothetical protein